MNNIWKQFGQTRPGHRALHHLMAIHHLSSTDGDATATGIARYLDVSRSSVAGALQSLKKTGHILGDGVHRYRLTSPGIDIVNAVLAKRRIVEIFLTEALGMTRLDAMADACKIEHLLSQQAADRMTALVGILGGDSPKARSFRTVLKDALSRCEPGEMCQGCPLQCQFRFERADTDTAATTSGNS